MVTALPRVNDARHLCYRALRMPLLMKILLVNSAIITMGAVAGTVITVLHVQNYPNDVHYELIALFTLSGVILSLAVNYLTLKWTLVPLDNLQGVVDEVRRGRLDVRVRPAAISDERFDQLAATFNQMLSRVEADAQQLHRLSGAILAAQEDERQRVARELHDETAQSLTSLLLRLRILEKSESPEQAREHVQELRALTAQALEDVRRVALELRPKILDDLGLVAALGWRVDELNALPGMRATLCVEGAPGRLPRHLELVLYRVAQEALTNIVRHAHASQVQLRLARDGSWITLDIRDDGVGFEPLSSVNKQREGLGLVGMRERVTLVGGELCIESQRASGTYVKARVPVSPSLLETASHG